MFHAMSVSSEHNLARLAEDAYHRRGDYPALLFEGSWHSSGELFDRACRVAGGLTALGVSPGERVVVTMANCPEVGIIYNAAWRAGAVVTPAMFLLPVDDLGVRKGFQKVYGLRSEPKAAKMIEIAEKWRPWRTVGSWYMWRGM